MADEGHGATVTFGTSAWSQTLTSIGHDGVSREALETSDLGTSNNETFIPSDLVNPGSLSIEWNYDPNNPPPYNAAAETITLTFPIPSGGAAGSTWAATGFMTDFSISGVENKSIMKGSATLKFSGAITQADSS